MRLAAPTAITKGSFLVVDWAKGGVYTAYTRKSCFLNILSSLIDIEVGLRYFWSSLFNIKTRELDL